MMNIPIASLALFGGASVVAGSYGYSATDVGTAHVVNNCNYPVRVCSIPASGGGYEQEEQTLAAGESWQHTWTELSNGNGWSIKLNKPGDLSHILQYEYTFHNNGIIWYDLSCVDGNPWNKDWEITANGTDCSPKQQAYRYSTDDAYGMQSCSQDTDITVTLCTGTSVDDGSAVNGSSSPASYSPASGSSAPSSTETSSTSAPVATSYGYNWNNEDASKIASDAEVTPTTLTTAATAVNTEADGLVTMTEVETVYATAEVTAYANRIRRHAHHAHQRHA